MAGKCSKQHDKLNGRPSQPIHLSGHMRISWQRVVPHGSDIWGYDIGFGHVVVLIVTLMRDGQIQSYTAGSLNIKVEHVSEGPPHFLKSTTNFPTSRQPCLSYRMRPSADDSR
jgi:hypothetical protein